MRLDHFSVVGILVLLVKCQVQHFINRWPSVNAANIGPLSFQNVGLV